MMSNCSRRSIDRDIKLWHLEERNKRRLQLSKVILEVSTAICLIENGRTLVSSGADQSLRVWDLESGNTHPQP